MPAFRAYAAHRVCRRAVAIVAAATAIRTRNQGTALIIAGSKDMPGAAALCTESALRSGAGLVTLATTEAITPIIQAKLSEPVFCSLEDCSNFNGTLQPQHIPTILQRAKHASAIAIGPGLSTNLGTVQAVIELLPQLNTPTVIDADALNAIATLNKNTAKGAANDSTVGCAATDCTAIQYLKDSQAPAILTPHVREFARLFGALPENSCDIPSYLKNISASTIQMIRHPHMQNSRQQKTKQKKRSHLRKQSDKFPNKF